MKSPRTTVNIYSSDYRDRVGLEIGCVINDIGQRVHFPIAFDVAEELHEKLGQIIREAKTDLFSDESVRDRALKRDDYHVNTRCIRCADDDCSRTMLAIEGDAKHVWEIAQERGWKRPRLSSDLFCPDSIKQRPKSVS